MRRIGHGLAELIQEQRRFAEKLGEGAKDGHIWEHLAEPHGGHCRRKHNGPRVTPQAVENIRGSRPGAAARR